MIKPLLSTLAITTLIVAVYPQWSTAAPTMWKPTMAHHDDSEPGGHLEATIDGSRVSLPALKTVLKADIQGDLVSLTVIQTFENPASEPMHATYLFPLQHDAAVSAMMMEVGDEVIRAQIQKVEAAKETFEAAKKQGKSAALLTQRRPNMFTQAVANLMPGKPIKITLKVVQTVPRRDGAYELVLPLVVGPRYQPNPEPARDKGWQLDGTPTHPPVARGKRPDAIDPKRVSIELRIASGLPIQRVESRTHALTLTRTSDRLWSATLTEGRTIDNRDFILRYAVAGDKADAGLLAFHDQRGGFFSLMIEPPASPAQEDITPREVVFVLDCSGSMSGKPIDLSKAFMREMLRRLRPSDTFRIIRFSEGATEFSKTPMAATQDNIQRGMAHIDGLEGFGGTRMTAGIEQALAPKVPSDALRLVIFMTDGYIGNDYEVIDLVKERLGSARLFALGVGAGVNRFLLSQMAHMGRGTFRTIDPTSNVELAAVQLASTLNAPILTDLSIDWGKLKPFGVSPERLPDLFSGESVRVQGRYELPGDYEIVIKGRLRGQEARLPLKVSLPEKSPHGDAVATIWARSAIKTAMESIRTPPRQRGKPAPATLDKDVRKTVEKLGLDFSIVTPWTAFVAVSTKIDNPKPDEGREVSVALPQVQGVPMSAYPQQRFTGQSTPEPGFIGGLLLALFAAFAARRARQSTPE